MRALKFVLFSVLCLAGVAIGAEQAPYNSSTISGLGARNIGSAAMSGRISAIAATREPSGKITLFVGAASGGVWKSEDGGNLLQTGVRRAVGAIDWCDCNRPKKFAERLGGIGRGVDAQQRFGR